MRHSIVMAAWFVAASCSVSSVFAAIEYHFVPQLNGQPVGPAQFASIAPVVGPQNFKVTLAGSLVGSVPSGAPNAAKAYLADWGLGVQNPAANGDVGVQGQVELDGKNGGEYVRLDYPDEVRPTYIIFSSVGSGDRFELTGDNQQVNVVALFGTDNIRDISAAQNLWPGHVDFTQAAQPLDYAKVWDVYMSSPDFGDGVQLENIGVEQVPEPTTLILWLVGFIAVGLSLAHRRTRSGPGSGHVVAG